MNLKYLEDFVNYRFFVELNEKGQRRKRVRTNRVKCPPLFGKPNVN